jgi:hypothetical protein
MAVIPDFAVLVTAIQRMLRSQSDHLPGNDVPEKQQDNAGTTRQVTLHTASTVILARQITIPVGSSSTTLLCNPAHSYPACASCIGGTAWGTTPGCGTSPTTTPITTQQTPTQQTTVVVSTPVQVTTPAPVATSTPAPATISSAAPAQISTSSTSSSNQVVHSASQATSFAFTSVIVPSITAAGAATKSAGGSAQVTRIGFPTAPFTGQALLTGTCTIPMYTALVMSNGGVLEAPIIGCGDDRPECCPSLAITSSQAAPTGAATLPVYESTAVASALSAYPISVCPSDYADLGSVCCPA